MTIPTWLLLAVMSSLVACSGGGGGSGGDDGGGGGDDGGDDGTTVARTGGVIALDEREAFCTELASTGELDYDECIQLVDDVATIHFAKPGCTSESTLVTAMVCLKTGTIAACDSELAAWVSALDSVSCEIDVYSVGLGDRYPFRASDSHCDGGVRADGGWCSRACSAVGSNATCAGTGSNGKNHFGTTNVCADDSFLGGHGCYPSCTSTADCQAWFGETRYGLRIACKELDDGSAPGPICVRVNDDRGIELP